MNWNYLFENIEQNLDLVELKNIVNENGEYKNIDPKKNIEIVYLNDNTPVGTIYYTEGKEMFKILFESKLISITKARLLNFIESEILKKELMQTGGKKLNFFDYEFMINMYLSADIASGQGYFKKSLSELVTAIEKGPIYLNSKEQICSITALNKTLRKEIYGFTGRIEDYIKK